VQKCSIVGTCMSPEPHTDGYEDNNKGGNLRSGESHFTTVAIGVAVNGSWKSTP
jgi:hypothetical protein